MDEQFKNIQKLAKMLEGKQLLSHEDLQGLVTDIVNAFAQYRSATSELNRNTTETLNTMLKNLQAEFVKTKSEVDSGLLLTKEELNTAMKKNMAAVKAAVKEIEAMKPLDGVSPDPKEIVKEVLTQIVLPEQKDVILDSPSELRDKLETLEGDDRLDAKAIKNLPKMVQESWRMMPSGSGSQPYVAGTNITFTKNGNGATVINGSAGSSGITIGTTAITSGTDTRVLFDDGGVVGENANFTFDKTNVRLQVGSGTTTSAGLTLGNVSSGVAGIFTTKGGTGASDYAISFASAGGGGADTISFNAITGAGTMSTAWKLAGVTKFSIGTLGNDTYVDGISTSSIYHFRVDGNNEKFALYGTAGRGPDITAGTATTNVNALSLTQTWNNSGVTFTGIKANVTNTSSAAASLLMDLQVGGSSKFAVNAVNSTVLINGATDPGYGTTFGGLVANASVAPFLRLDVGGTQKFIAFHSGTVTQLVGANTILLEADGGVIGLYSSTGSVRLGAATDVASPTAQTISVQSVIAGTTNTAGANLSIKGSAGTGTGAGGSIIFQVAPAGSTGTSQNALSSVLTLAAPGIATILNPTDTASLQILNLKGARATPTASDEIYQSFTLNNSSSAAKEFARITTLASVTTASSEQGRLQFAVQSAGALTQVITMTSAEIYPFTSGAMNLGLSSRPWGTLFLQSGGVINFNAGNATITHSASLLTSNVAFSVGTSNAITAGSIELGHASDTTITRVSAGKIAVEGVNVGYLEIPQNSQSAAYTTVLADSGKHILHPSSDNNARTFTIDSNANVAYPVGTAITFINQINTVTIAITSDTLTLMGAGTTGSRTLAANGIATAVKVASTSWVISGTNLT